MVKRLGNVIYWAGNSAAVLLSILAFVVYLGKGEDYVMGSTFYVVFAYLAHLTGRATRYVLTGAH